MENINAFNTAAADILGRLYKAFPIPQQKMQPLEWEKEAIAAGIFNPERSIEPGRRETESFYNHVFLWLVDEGFIRHGARTANTNIYMGVVLTSKGFAALSRPLEVLEHKETIGHFLGTASKEAALALIQGAVSAALRFS